MSLRSPNAVILATLELDDFAVLVSRHGTLTGDRILVEVARRITRALREYDTVGRLGRGSFLLLLPDADLRGGRLALERVVASVRARSISAVRASIPARVSVGVAEAQAGRADLDAAIERAYRALGTARAQGSEQVVTRAEATAAVSAAPPLPVAPEPRAA